MVGLPGISPATNAFNAQTGRYIGGKFFDPTYANDPKNAQSLNLASAANELINIKQLYCSRYKWTCDNESIPVDYIESMLFHNGMMAFFNDDTYGWMLLPCSIRTLNVYGQPETVLVSFPFSGVANRVLHRDEFVLVRDNPANNIPYFTVQYYTRLIADVGRSCEVYAQGMKKPMIIVAKFENEKGRKVFLNNISRNETHVVIDKSTIDDLGTTLEVLQNSSHNATDLKGLAMYKTDLYNECVAKLGIVTPTVMKQAQVNKDEINKNDTMANIVLQGTFDCRQEAVKKIYEMSKITLTCAPATDLSDGINTGIKNPETE